MIIVYHIGARVHLASGVYLSLCSATDWLNIAL